MSIASGWSCPLWLIQAILVNANLATAPEHGKLALQIFHSLDAAKCRLALDVSCPRCPHTLRFGIPDDWEAGMYTLALSEVGIDGWKSWQGILVVKPGDVEAKNICGAQALPATRRPLEAPPPPRADDERSTPYSLLLVVEPLVNPAVERYRLMQRVVDDDSPAAAQVRVVCERGTRRDFIKCRCYLIISWKVPEFQTISPASFLQRVDSDNSAATAPATSLGCLPNGEPAASYKELCVFNVSGKKGSRREYQKLVGDLVPGKAYSFLSIAEAQVCMPKEPYQQQVCMPKELYQQPVRSDQLHRKRYLLTLARSAWQRVQ